MKKIIITSILIGIFGMVLTGCFLFPAKTTDTNITYTVDPNARNADFSLNGYYAVNNPNTQYLQVGNLVNEPSGISRVGYDLAGWYLDKNGTTKWNFSTDTLSESHILLYAKWNKQSYTINYNLNGGVGTTPASEVKTYFEYNTVSKQITNKLTKPLTNPTNSGEYSLFAGWWEKDGAGNYIREWNYTTDLPSKNMTLYAGWAKAGLTDRYAYLELATAIKILTFIPEADPVSNEIVIPSTFNGKPVISIGYQAFNNIDDYYTMTLPPTLATINDEAFINSYCANNIIIPNTVTSIGKKAFYGCDNLYRIVIGSGVLNIGEQAFYGCVWLHNSTEQLSIPSSVIAIEKDAFSAFSSTQTPIAKLLLHNGLILIGEQAFQYAHMDSVNVPNTVEIIDNTAFGNNIKIGDITIGKAITYIGSYAFSQCKNGTHVDVQATTPPALGGGNPRVFGEAREFLWIKVPQGSMDAYKAATNWSYYTDRFTWFIIT